jgi:hypothetical protein
MNLEKFREARERIMKRIRERRKTKGKTKTMPNPPRYDDVYFRGVEWLDSLGGVDAPIKEGLEMTDIMERLLLCHQELGIPILLDAHNEILTLRSDAGLKQCLECNFWFGHGKKGTINRCKFCSTQCKNRWHARVRRARMREESK